VPSRVSFFLFFSLLTVIIHLSLDEECGPLRSPLVTFLDVVGFILSRSFLWYKLYRNQSFSMSLKSFSFSPSFSIFFFFPLFLLWFVLVHLIIYLKYHVFLLVSYKKYHIFQLWHVLNNVISSKLFLHVLFSQYLFFKWC
jgi:hypothetical protein